MLAYDARFFQIVGGPVRRLQEPGRVAVDVDDNSYVSDSERGLILVYDSEGNSYALLEASGTKGCSRKAGHLYVVDPPRHTLFILDLQGNLLARVGHSESDGRGFKLQNRRNRARRVPIPCICFGPQRRTQCDRLDAYPYSEPPGKLPERVQNHKQR